MTITAYSLGTIEYQRAWQLQNWLAGEIAQQRKTPALLFLQHPHTYTFGRQGKRENLLWDEAECARRGIAVHWTDRGGDVTYHGPGQLVGYPLLPLRPLDSPAQSKMDTLGYLRKLEDTLMRTLGEYGIPAGRVAGQTGVWVTTQQNAPAKIASIGVRVDARGITRHGFALNVNPQMHYWEGIVACGLENQAKTSMHDLLENNLTPQELIPTILQQFGEVFETEINLASPQEVENILA